MSDENFLSRWSRLKRASLAGSPETTADAVPVPAGNPVPEPADEAAQPAPLPPVESLTPESDFAPFMRSDVDPGLRRDALKKLFADPQFNVMDGLDVYIDDYSKTEPIPAAMLASLKQAQNIFQWAKEDAEARRKAGTGAENAAREAEVDAAPESLEARSDTPEIPNVKVGEATPVSSSETNGTGRS